MTVVSNSISPESTMAEITAAYPGAQRALFRRYHIGGCSSCAFQPEETLAQLCARNGNLNPIEVIEQIQASHEQDAALLIEPAELARLLRVEGAVQLIDVRSREEYEAVHIPHSRLLSQEVMREIMASGSNDRPLILVDHQGKNALDAAAYFIGHGLKNVRCLRGGIDAWSQEIDSNLPRYTLGK